MIDVVFLLLVFFMLASRFGQDVVIDLPISVASDKPYQGPPRLIDVLPDGVQLNGVDKAMADLLPELGAMMLSHTDAIILRAKDKADLQRVVEVMELLGRPVTKLWFWWSSQWTCRAPQNAPDAKASCR